ncbi:MAG TPA: NAD-dependent epimerase/dehydratase family protein [Burkholderiales bacterium]|nr:NAD-dependent epimerase/dehydratase family protein [Burkholderiales bacterium]
MGRMNVLVTHAGGSFAQALLPALCARAGVERVTAVDIRPVRVEHPKLVVISSDPLRADAASLFAGHDALVHLPPATGVRAAAEDVEAAVRPAHRLFHAAHAAGLTRLVQLSTAAVYGPAIHAHEQSPLRPFANSRYAREQAHLEQLLTIDFPQCVRLRPHLIAGPHADRRLKRVLRQPFYPGLPDPQPLYQCVHEDDLAAAVLRVLESDARGPYNIAAEDSFSLKDAIRRRHLLAFALSRDRARSALAFASRHLRWELDPIWLDIAGETLLVNCRRAVTELGWRCRYTGLEALAAT